MYFQHYNIITPLGLSLEQTTAAVLKEQSAIQNRLWQGFPKEVPMAAFNQEEVQAHFSALGLRGQFSPLAKTLLLAVAPLLEDLSPDQRTLLILSTTKGDIDQLHPKNPLPYLQELAQTIAHTIGLNTTPLVVSNACVSGAMALSVAQRLLYAGSFDKVLVLAADQVSTFVLSGFAAFQAMSLRPCRPYDAQRDGINLGEAAAAALLTRTPDGALAQLIGSSSINDANHISGPSRNGEGLYLSIQRALAQANISPQQIDLINAHGTGTQYNDEMESIAFMRAGLLCVPLNSYKGYFGHTLGAAGLLETVLSLALAHRQTLLQSLNFQTLGVSQPINVLTQNLHKPIKYLLKTASGFGGSNTALLIKINN